MEKRPGRFYNLDTSLVDKKTLLEVLRWKITGKPKSWPKNVQNSWNPQLPSHIEKNEVFVTFINHATALIQLDGLNILTDPIFSDIAGPYQWLGPKRVRPPGMPLLNLPKIDVVLVSHNHYDHMDLPSLHALWEKDQPLYIIPLKNRHYLQGIDKIVELDWWQEHQLTPDQSVILTPAQHWSRRGFFDHCKALWGGFLLQSPHLKVFFAGDTGYNSHFQQIKEKYGAIDVSLLPIGAYEPRWFMRYAHMDPADAVQAHLDLESEFSIGIHFGTFRLTDEGINDPVLDLKKNLHSRGLKEQSFVAPENGLTVSYKKHR